MGMIRRIRISRVLSVSFLAAALLYNGAAIPKFQTPYGGPTPDARVPPKKRPHADGCHHVFVDGGANIGVHGRFLLEPEKYPDAAVAHFIFNSEFGERRDNRDFCVYEIEANPSHLSTLTNKSEAYARMGWRYHVLNVGLGDRYGAMTFYRRNDEYAEEWGFSLRKFFDDAIEVEVPVIRFSAWLRENVLSRRPPSEVHGTYAKNATVVVKLDIEGSEYMVLPDLISSGVYCELDYVFGEFHSPNAPYDIPGLHVDLKTSGKVRAFELSMMRTMEGFGRNCKARYIKRGTTRHISMMEYHCRSLPHSPLYDTDILEGIGGIVSLGRSALRPYRHPVESRPDRTKGNAKYCTQ